MKLSERITPKNDDEIYRVRTFIQELSRVQDYYFEKLKTEIGANEGREANLLFDFVYNSGDEDFVEYLREFNS